MNNFATTVRQELINKGIPENIIFVKELPNRTMIIVDIEQNYVEIIDWEFEEKLDHLDDDIDNVLYADSANTLYGLYRNENMVLAGNNMYEKVFIDAATNIVQEIYKMRV